MRRQKIFFIVLALLGALSAGYFSILAVGAVYDFASLKESAQAYIIRWEIKETKGKFPLTAAYSFEANGRIWLGSTRLSEPWHLNEDAAVAALQEKAKQTWTVWYDPCNPFRSSLEKQFPLGLIIRAMLSYGVFVYFILFFRKVVKTNL